MLRCGRVAPVLAFCFIAASCHKKTLPAPPVVPQAGAPETVRPRPATPAATAPPPATAAPPTTSPSPELPPQTVQQPGAPPRVIPSPPATQPPTAARPEFRLGQAITPEEQRTNNSLIDQHLLHTSQALATIGNRRLTNEEKSTLAQIRGFMDQAKQMRTTDVVRARSLAERADILTQDLLARLKAR